MNGSMSGDIAVQLADGVYRQTSPLRFTAADSGTGGHTVSWQAASGAHPVISGAKAVTGWSLADSSKNIWKANVGTGVDTRQLYVDGAPATRARTSVNRSDFTFTATGMRFSTSALSYLNNLTGQNRVEVESVGSFTDRYSPVQSIGGNVLTMQQPAWNNNNFGYDTLSSPFRAGPLYLENAYEFLDSPGEWYLNTATGTLYYIPRSGQSMSSADVELPLLQSLLDVGGTYDSPAHDLAFTGITFTGTSWLGPSGSDGYADQQTGAYLSGDRSWPAFGSCNSGCTQFEAARPHWSQMPAAVQVSAASGITFGRDQFVDLGQNAVGIGNDANAHASGVGLGTASVTVSGSVFTGDAAGAIVAGGVQADAHHPGDQRMVNKNLTISDNVVHDIGLDYRGITSFLPTYVTNATITHNEVYNMPYSGISVGFGWGANDAGGSNDYANRGLYNYQPRYSTATTASNDQITGNYVHDVMQQMNDGGCVYTLSANPGGLISGNYCLRTNGYFGLYFDEGSRYFTASGNVFSSIGGTWAVENANGNNNTGTLTLAGNWYSNGGTNINNGDRGNSVSGNTLVSNNTWPSGAQSVMASAGVRPGDGGGPTTGVLRGTGSGRCLDVPNGSQSDGTYLQIYDCNGGAGQQWTLNASNELTVYGGKCLDVPNNATSPGTRVEIWTCNGGANQQWHLNSDGTVVGVGSGLCLDVTGQATANGTAVEIWTCNGQGNQKWSRS
ncbi:hypothetical protein Airi02_105330 [Actinoallomurus iriomotensis]|uniref:Ricin B lectin domain-containing protein n=2 Tax=Actinoallomurus iriomotensis TaxID=478107 RepID=A0A9W6SGP7_9ACTN|nr:hypothetical protein Airi02_105330 [Actinoallomurus iriomotensis]